MGVVYFQGLVASCVDRIPTIRVVVLCASVSVAFLFIVLLYGLYNVFLHPLRKYPGPLLWRAYRVPYVISIHKGEIHRRMKDFHRVYGPIVRIAPNELSYTDGTAWKDIYANRTGHLTFERNPTWFKKMEPTEPMSIMGPDEEAHARFRKAFSNAFSEKSLRDQAPLIDGYVDAFITQLKVPVSGGRWTEKTVDLVRWLNYVTFDISGDLSFGESFDCVKNGKAHPWVETVTGFGKGLVLIASLNMYPPMEKLLRYVIPKHILKQHIDFRAMTAAKAEKRLAMDTDRPDFVTPTKKHSDQKSAITDQEWAINMMIIVFAGSETTASVLSGILRELVQNRGVLSRLTNEIRSAFETEQEIKIASTGNLSYLNAVINEGHRLCPAVAIGVPRVVPRGGDSICGQWVPGGTYVAVNQFAANRQLYNFHNPNSFIPERFLDSKHHTDDMSTFQPFGFGRHSCIGMKLAYAEMRLILARLLYAFDLSLADDKDRWDWGQQKTYILWEKEPLKVTLRRSGKS
ncbi:cytochrome P450 [Lophiotrema nucula]|uniref:Cytochrome P450 n=1 Tax=Lophiotrema nucula TaxID=690887 RepID=A0A6A5ZLR7_9PLEO|nr:cytochrome P450 [Lophiotrema nucula]